MYVIVLFLIFSLLIYLFGQNYNAIIAFLISFFLGISVNVIRSHNNPFIYIWSYVKFVCFLLLNSFRFKTFFPFKNKKFKEKADYILSAF